jgi:hypothetical protein
MRDFAVLFLHLLATVARLAVPTENQAVVEAVDVAALCGYASRR